MVTSFFLFYSGLIDPGIMLRGKIERTTLQPEEKKVKIARIRQLGYICNYKNCTTCGIIFYLLFL